MNDTPSSVRVNSYKIIHVYKCISYVWNVIIIVTMMLELSFHALYILHYYSSFRLRFFGKKFTYYLKDISRINK